MEQEEDWQEEKSVERKAPRQENDEAQEVGSERAAIRRSAKDQLNRLHLTLLLPLSFLGSCFFRRLLLLY